MLVEIAQEARDMIAAQPGLFKEWDYGSSRQKGVRCSCVGLTLTRLAWDRMISDVALMEAFCYANEIPFQHLAEVAVYDWNDAPERTVAEAVAALDNLVKYLAATEQG